VNLPAPWRAPATAVVLRVADFPPQDMLDELDLHDPLELTGLYDGTPLTEKSVMDQPERTRMWSGCSAVPSSRNGSSVGMWASAT